jgi:hypothetical protein
MAGKYWIKLYHEILDDPKMGRLRVALRWRFIECLLVAGENGNDGFLPDTEDLAWRLRCEPEKLETDLVELANTGLLNRVDGQWLVVKFKVRQDPSKAAMRMRRYRQRKKEAKKEKEEETYTDTDTYRARNALRNDNVTPPQEKLPPLPVHLAVPELMNVWGEWKQYHEDRGKPLTRTTALKQFKRFEQMGIEAAVVALDYSMEQNYTGLVQPKGNRKAPVPEPARVGGRY